MAGLWSSLAVFALVALLLPGQSLGATAHLVLDSQPGDYVGQGGHYDIHYSLATSDWFYPFVYFYVDGVPSYVAFSLINFGAENTTASLAFSTNMLNLPLQRGTFLDAQRAPFAAPGHPGLDVAFQNRGLNRVTGRFTIDYLSFMTGSDGLLVIETLGVRFEQRGGSAMAALFGTFTYDARNVPEAGTGIVALSLVALCLLRRSRRNS